jgi:bacillithiol system protein YtxJ
MNWNTLESLAQIEEIVIESENTPVAIFKHSTTCSISVMAKKRLETSWNLELPAYYLDLKAHRNISDELSKRFDVHHESPQLLLIKNGECIHDASHFDINVGEIKEVLEYEAR